MLTECSRIARPLARSARLLLLVQGLLGLPAHQRRRLTEAHESGALNTSSNLVSVRSVLGLREGGQEVLNALRPLKRMGLSGLASAAWIRAVEEKASSASTPEALSNAVDKAIVIRGSNARARWRHYARVTWWMACERSASA